MLRENATRFMGTSGVEETIDQGRVRILRAWILHAKQPCYTSVHSSHEECEKKK